MKEKGIFGGVIRVIWAVLSYLGKRKKSTIWGVEHQPVINKHHLEVWEFDGFTYPPQGFYMAKPCDWNGAEKCGNVFREHPTPRQC